MSIPNTHLIKIYDCIYITVDIRNRSLSVKVEHHFTFTRNSVLYFIIWVCTLMYLLHDDRRFLQLSDGNSRCTLNGKVLSLIIQAVFKCYFRGPDNLFVTSCFLEFFRHLLWLMNKWTYFLYLFIYLQIPILRISDLFTHRAQLSGFQKMKRNVSWDRISTLQIKFFHEVHSSDHLEFTDGRLSVSTVRPSTPKKSFSYFSRLRYTNF